MVVVVVVVVIVVVVVPAHLGSPGQTAIKRVLLCCCKSITPINMNKDTVSLSSVSSRVMIP